MKIQEQHEATILQLQEQIAQLKQEKAVLRAELNSCQQTEASLRLSERRFRTIFEQAPTSIQILLPNGRTLHANRANYELFNVPANFYDYSYNILDDQQLVDNGIMPLIHRAFAGEAVTFPPVFYDSGQSMPSEFSEHKGCKTWTQGIMYPIKDEQGSFDEIVLMHVDITALKAAEAAIPEEQERAAQERLAELAKANKALKQSLDLLATEPELDKILGHVLGAIANQFQSPLAEYWYHPEGNVAYVSMMSWLGQILNREEISKVFPTHPGLDGFRVPPELMGGESLQHRKQYLIYEDHRTNPFTQHLDWVANWMVSQGLFKEINVPMTLGNDTIGALIIRLPGDRQVTTQQIELAQALAHQATLAVKLTQLAQESRMATLLEERNRMAREIHDTLAQAFTGILMQLQAATGFLVNKPEQTSQCIIRAQDLAQSGLAQARQSVWYLHQDDLEADNLPQTLTRIAQQMTSGTSVQVEVYIQGTPYCLNAEVGMNLLRIAQESLTNALRHAEAQMIHLCLGYESDRIQLRVRDDGRGFDRQGQISGGFGLKGMQQRCDRIGAKLEINSQPGAGTEVNVVKALPN